VCFTICIDFCEWEHETDFWMMLWEQRQGTEKWGASCPMIALLNQQSWHIATSLLVYMMCKPLLTTASMLSGPGKLCCLILESPCIMQLHTCLWRRCNWLSFSSYKIKLPWMFTVYENEFLSWYAFECIWFSLMEVWCFVVVKYVKYDCSLW
jgi:hypothetical protein